MLIDATFFLFLHLVNKTRGIMRFCIVFFALIFFTACQDNNNDDLVFINQSCGNDVVINESIFNAAFIFEYTIKDVVISRATGCLTITIEANGCEGDSWTADLITLDEVDVSSPPSRRLKLILNNQETCTTVIERSFTFNLSPLAVPNSSVVVLNLAEWDPQIVYTY